MMLWQASKPLFGVRVAINIFTRRNQMIITKQVRDLVEELFFDYDRMSRSGQETLDELSDLLENAGTGEIGWKITVPAKKIGETK